MLQLRPRKNELRFKAGGLGLMETEA
jgi:hypothetical protein